MVVRPERVRVEPPEDRREPVAGEGRPRRLRRSHLTARGHPRPRDPDPVHAGQRRGSFILRRGAPVSVYLPCEALRVLRTEHTGANEEESWEHSAERPGRQRTNETT